MNIYLVIAFNVRHFYLFVLFVYLLRNCSAKII